MAQRPTKQLKVSELDFDQIKTNLKEFLRSQDTLSDYDFEGSALSTIIDVMAYVTHYNAINANIGINETFLETAQSRGSIVAHARQLGYTPKSATGATANIFIQVDNPNNNTLTLEKGHRFRSVVDNETYTFVTTHAYTTNNAIFPDVEIKQGESKTVEYLFDVDTAERFVIPDLNVDTSTLDVRVFDSDASTSYTSFIPVKNINDVTPTSLIYLLSESFDGRYEIRFGDGSLGLPLVNGNRIEINYLITSGADGNRASRFTSVDTVEGNSNLSITTNQIADGGTPKESLRSIKNNAPLTFTAQNRAVTTSDYRAIILENFNNVNSVVVWGGENNDPPQYGKVFISVIPAFGETLTSDEKETIIEDIIRPKAVLSITPEFIDPEYTYVALEVFYNRNPINSPLSVGQVNTIVEQAIVDYNDAQLRKFDGILRYSTLLNTIDNAEKSIVNSAVRVYLKKRFVPILNQSVRYELTFSSPIYTSPTRNSVVKYSSVFTFNNEECILQDYVNSSGQRKLRVVRSSDIDQAVVAGDVGFVDAAAGKIVLEDFNVSQFDGPHIEIEVIPDSNDVAPKRNNIVAIDPTDIRVIGNDDPTTVDPSLSGINYDLVSRHD